MRLTESALAQLPAPVARPRYDRQSVQTGIVHFGPGAFHRAHQAWYIEQQLARDPRWGISAISLRNTDVRDALQPQDSLYTLAVRDETISYQVIGAVQEVLVAPEDPATVVARLSAPGTHLVTLTVTEKGYCLGADGALDSKHPDIQRDIRAPLTPVSALGFITEGLRLRRAVGLPPFTVISCDNLPDNGVKLGRAIVELAGHTDRSLAQWIENEVRFPRTMVDSITPATTEALKQSVSQALGGVADQWPVQREGFAQWVIEDSFHGVVPDWQGAGVTLTNDVAGYDRAKLRLVNGAHSMLAYAGLLRGHVTVADAMKDTQLSALVRSMMLEDILPSLKAPRGLDLPTYVDAILERCRNPNMHHELVQIAMDGSQKLPIRILGTVRDALAAGRAIERLCVPIAAWLHFVRRAACNGTSIKDPLSPSLLAIGRACEGRGQTDVPRFLSLEAVFAADLRADSRFTHALIAAYDRLASCQES